jgi:hypothetical protein
MEHNVDFPPYRVSQNMYACKHYYVIKNHNMNYVNLTKHALFFSFLLISMGVNLLI